MGLIYKKSYKILRKCINIITEFQGYHLISVDDKKLVFILAAIMHSDKNNKKYCKSR